MNIEIEDLQNFAEDAGLTHVVLFGSDGVCQHVVTWGKTAEGSIHCAKLGNFLKSLMQWPEDKMNSVPDWVQDLAHLVKEMNHYRHHMSSQSIDLLDVCEARLKEKLKGTGHAP